MSIIHNIAAFLQALRQHHIVDAAQLKKINAELRQTFPDARSLAGELVQRGWLTPYQVNQIFQGRGQDLVFGPYVLLERLGEGGMGLVFKARHAKMMRVVALKIIRKERLSKPEAIRRFHREVRAAAQLSHPNVVLAFDADRAGALHYYAMEYVEGTDLGRLVQERGPLPPELACEYIRQTALGLQHAFERGLVHRDIKPSNLLLQKPRPGISGAVPVVKVLDMGLARVHHEGDETNSGTLTQQGALMGTLDYLSPEQARDSHEVDIRADLYSLGCTAYFLLTGKVPFSGGSAAGKIYKHQFEEPLPLEQLRPGLPREVVGVVRKLMAKRPEDRFQTPGALAVALAELLTSGSLPVPDHAAACQPARTAAGVPLAEPVGSLSAIGHESLTDTAPGWSAILSRSATVETLPPEPVVPAPPRKKRRGPLLAGIGGTSLIAGLVLCVALLSGNRSVPPSSAGEQQPASGKAPRQLVYLKKATREETILATLLANQLPTLQGKWHYIGPFDNGDGFGFVTVYPPEREVALGKVYRGKGGVPVAWKEFVDFRVGQCLDLALFKDVSEKNALGCSPIHAEPWGCLGQVLAGQALSGNEWACVYLYHEIEVPELVSLPISLGSDDTLTVWLNGKLLVSQNAYRMCLPDQDFAVLNLEPGKKNELLVKVCQGHTKWEFYIMPQWPRALDAAFGSSLLRDFSPQAKVVPAAGKSAP